MKPSRRSFIAGLLVLAVIAGVLAFNLTRIARGWQSLRPLRAGDRALPFTLPTLQGQPLSLEQQRGHVVLIIFWASWCAPCRRELPLLSRLQQERAAQGLRVLAINVEGSAEKAREALADSGADHLTALLDDGTVAERYGVQTLPHQLVIDRDGKVRYVQVGSASLQRLRPHLEAALRAAGSQRVKAGASPRDRSRPNQ